MQVGKSSLIDGFIGECPFCNCWRTRQLHGVQEAGGISGDDGGDGKSDKSDLDMDLMDAAPTTTMGGDQSSAVGSESWSQMGARRADGSVHTLQFLSRLSIYKNQVTWNRAELPDALGNYLDEIRSSTCAACNALAIKSPKTTTECCKFVGMCRCDDFIATQLYTTICTVFFFPRNSYRRSICRTYNTGVLLSFSFLTCRRLSH